MKDINWELRVNNELAKGLREDQDELDVVLELVQSGFRLEFLPRNNKHYKYIEAFMIEHGLI